jgi:tetratricopeptide (TPR) repeat protein
VSNRWFIPLLGLSCLGLVIAVRLYSSSGDERIPTRVYAATRPAASPAAVPAAPKAIPKSVPSAQPAAARKDRRADAGGQTSIPRRSRRPTVSIFDRLKRVAGSLDESSVDLRNDLSASPEAWLLRGWLAMRTNDARQAIACFDRVPVQSGWHCAALSAKAEALVVLSRYDEAAAAYGEVVRLAPQDPTARYNYGVLLYRRAYFSEAAEQFRELVRLQPDDARGQYNLATLAQREGRLAEAREAWQAFVRLEPNVASAWFNLGIVWMDYEEPGEAADCFERATIIDSEDTITWLNLAVAYAGAGELQLALDAVAEADALSPGDPAVTSCQAALEQMLAEQKTSDSEEH